MLIIAGLMPAREGYAQPPVSLKVIEEAWKRREEKVRTAKFEWTEQKTVAKGTSSAMIGIVSPKLVAGKTIPPNDTTLEDRYVLVLDGQRIRLETATHQWSFKSDRYEPGTSVATYNGVLGKQLSPDGTPDRRWPQGSIRAEKHHMEATSPLLRPILMTYRGLVVEMRSYDLLAMQPTGRTLRLGKHECIELHRRPRGRQTDENLWVDPARDFVIVRSMLSKDGQVVNQIDVDYKPSVEAGWVPERWSTVMVNLGGKCRITCRATMTAVRFDPKVDDRTFDLEFPPGTIGFDNRDSKQFFVPALGVTKPLSREEQAGTYQQLVENTAKESRIARTWTWCTIAAVLIGGGSLILLGFRRWRLGHPKRTTDMPTR